MPRGYLCIVLAAVGWLALTGANLKPAAQPEQSKVDGGVGDAAANVAAQYDKLPKRPESSPERQPCGPRQYQSKDDLCAQWKAADAAADAAGWAKWGTWISGVGLIAVAIAIFLTIQFNRIARDTAKRQLRAYMSIEPKGILEAGDDGIAQAVVFMHNTGQTPAYNVQLFSWFKVVDDPLAFSPKDDDPKEKPRDYERDSSIASGSGSHVYCGMAFSPTKAAMTAVSKKQMAIIQYGVVTYDDTFGDAHETFFAHYHWGEELSDANAKHCRFGNHAT